MFDRIGDEFVHHQAQRLHHSALYDEIRSVELNPSPEGGELKLEYLSDRCAFPIRLDQKVMGAPQCLEAVHYQVATFLNRGLIGEGAHHHGLNNADEVLDAMAQFIEQELLVIAPLV